MARIRSDRSVGTLGKSEAGDDASISPACVCAPCCGNPGARHILARCGNARHIVACWAFSCLLLGHTVCPRGFHCLLPLGVTLNVDGPRPPSTFHTACYLGAQPGTCWDPTDTAVPPSNKQWELCWGATHM